ncbi:adenylyl-sulfate kinase [Nocardiopsis salina]|uniref:adenylyl-sulfate kinase n=1 Tax=Nocardiopsis salina TaxID=245836 RepID=UPI00036BE943|nr:adenylyl-sulfate kinase [Nocardiopsis salina]
MVREDRSPEDTDGVDVPSLAPGPEALAHLELVLSGACPLSGFMTGDESASVEREGRLPDGRVWPVPVTLEVPESLSGADRVTLTDPEGAPLAELRVSEYWRGGAGTLHAAGEVELVRPPMYGVLRELRLTPAEVRGQHEAGPFADRPLLAVVTDRPLHHRALHQIRECAEELGRAEVLVLVDTGLTDGNMASAVLAAEPLLPARTTFVALTLPRDRSGTGFGGRWTPRQTGLAAHVAGAYGATHVMVEGGSAPEAAEGGAEYVDPGPWRFDEDSQLWSPAEKVPEATGRDEFTDDEVEAELAHGRELPAWFTPARVAAEMARLRPARTRRGLTVLLSGLSGSGKSTIARGVCDGIRRSGRTVTLLDGDVVRRLLSKGLTFSREDRELNIRRIGYVASEITRHGGVAVCAPIAPYEAGRREVQAMVEEFGDFFLVHVATPLEVCEERDRKGLYAKARAGEIPEFTGISDPYEEPVDPALVVDTTGTDPAESVAEVLAALREGGWLPQ